MGVLCGRVCVGVKAVRVVVGGGRSEIAGIVAPQNGGDAPARLRRSVPPRNPPSSKWDMTAFESDPNPSDCRENRTRNARTLSARVSDSPQALQIGPWRAIEGFPDLRILRDLPHRL